MAVLKCSRTDASVRITPTSVGESDGGLHWVRLEVELGPRPRVHRHGEMLTTIELKVLIERIRQAAEPGLVSSPTFIEPTIRVAFPGVCIPRPAVFGLLDDRAASPSYQDLLLWADSSALRRFADELAREASTLSSGVDC